MAPTSTMLSLQYEHRSRFVCVIPNTITMISLLLMLAAGLEISQVTAVHYGGSYNALANQPVLSTRQQRPTTLLHSRACAWMSCSSASWGFTSMSMNLRGGASSSDSSPEDTQNATEETILDDDMEKATAGEDEPSSQHHHAALATPDDAESDEIIDMDDQEDDAMDVRGGSSCEPGACSGGMCGAQQETFEEEDLDGEDVKDKHDNISEEQSNDVVAADEKLDTSAATVASVPPGGATSDEPDDEPSNGHTAVADASHEEEETPPEPAVVVEEEPAVAVVEKEEAPVAVVEEVSPSEEQHEATEAGSAEAAAPAVTLAEPDVAAQVADAVATAAAATTVDDADAVAPQEIDAETAKILIQDLKYRRYEVRGMQPHIAAIVVEKRLRRPQEGIPTSWYVDASKIPPAWRQNLEDWLPKIVVPVLVGGIGVTVYLLHQQKGDSKPLSLSIGPLTNWFKSIKPVRVSSGTTAVTTPTTTQAPPAVSSETAAAPMEPASVATTSNAAAAKIPAHDTHPHSIRPYVHEKPPAEEELDESWLDKLLTGISKNVKAFFRMKI